MRHALVILASVGLSTMLSSCDYFFPTYASYHYKLTISLDTPDGPKTADGVMEVSRVQAGKFWETMGGCGERIRGEAIYLDLGAGRRPLVVLPGISWWQFTPRRDRILSPTRMLTLVTDHEHNNPDAYYGQFEHCAEAARRLRSVDGVFDVQPYDLPDLVTFGDVADPNTVMYVDPEHLEATLGPGVTWRAVTIQITDRPVTTGLEQKLPWLKTMTDSSYLDGSPTLMAATTNLANKLQRASFIFPYPLR